MAGKRRGKRGGPRVEVRKGRDGLELRVDGTFASLYRPDDPATGSVWDAIAAPVLALPPSRSRRPSVLILGLGGGSAARIVRALRPEAQIVGVEFDPAVVRVARARFGLDELDVEVVVADALQFLSEERRRFDIILEDVFVGVGNGVHKPGWLPLPGHELAAARLKRDGLLVSNTLDEAGAVKRVLAARFPRILRIEVDGYDNRVFAAGPAYLDAGQLRWAVARSCVLGNSVGRMSFRGERTQASRSAVEKL
jgi:spermidine synthase